MEISFEKFVGFVSGATGYRSSAARYAGGWSGSARDVHGPGRSSSGLPCRKRGKCAESAGLSGENNEQHRNARTEELTRKGEGARKRSRKRSW